MGARFYKPYYFLVLVIAILFSSCSHICEHKNAFPAYEFDCEVKRDNAALGEFTYNTDSTLRSGKFAVSLNSDTLRGEFVFFDEPVRVRDKSDNKGGVHELRLGDWISFYRNKHAINNTAALYQVVHIEPTYIIISSFFPVPREFSGRPRARAYKMKICEHQIEIYGKDGSDVTKDKPILVFSI